MDTHNHCINCYSMNCKYDLCRLVRCRQSTCLFKMHECKQRDHLNICSRMRIPCLNSEYGCHLYLFRANMTSHLEHCPASAVSCSFEYNRWPVHSREKHLKNFHKLQYRSIDDSSLNSSLKVGLAFRDQQMLHELYKFKNIRRLFKNNLTRKYPAVPMAPYLSATKKLNLPEDKSNDDLSSNLLLNDLTKCSSFVSNASSITASTITNSDEESDSVWPPGLQKSLCEKLANKNLLSNDDKESESSASSSTDSSTGENKCKVKKTKKKKKFKNPGKLDYLILDLNIEFIANHQIKPKKIYTFRCGTDFRRDEYCSHYQNVHSDIMGSLNSMEKFCPLQQYGCPFYVRRLHPMINNQKTKIIFSQQNKAFGHLIDENTIENDKQLNSLTDLPFELISRIIGFLDAFSLNNLALTSKTMRWLCQNQLENRGLVSLIWRKEIKQSSDQVNWRVIGFEWRFSNHFDLITNWKLDNDDKLLNHISKCEHFDRLYKKEPFKLIGLGARN